MLGDKMGDTSGMTRYDVEQTSRKKAPPVGLEPTTNGLTVRCSTN